MCQNHFHMKMWLNNGLKKYKNNESLKRDIAVHKNSLSLKNSVLKGS